MIFCKDCKYYREHYNCEYPDNIIIKYDWEMKWKSNIEHPRYINRKNDCKWFFRKENK